MRERLGLYVGSFAPFTVGHLDIAKQAQKVFPIVRIARGINPEKPERNYPMPRHFLEKLDFEVDSYETLLSDYINTLEIGYIVTLIRGLRNGNDLAYEQTLVAFLRELCPELRVTFFLCEPQNQHISSSAVRGLEKFSRDKYLRYVVTD